MFIWLCALVTKREKSFLCIQGVNKWNCHFSPCIIFSILSKIPPGTLIQSASLLSFCQNSTLHAYSGHYNLVQRIVNTFNVLFSKFNFISRKQFAEPNCRVWGWVNYIIFYCAKVKEWREQMSNSWRVCQDGSHLRISLSEWLNISTTKFSKRTMETYLYLKVGMWNLKIGELCKFFPSRNFLGI